MENIDEVKLLEQMMRDRSAKVFTLDLDMRFGKRLLATVNDNEALRIQNQLNQWEKIREGEVKYLEFLQEVYKEKTKINIA